MACAAAVWFSKSNSGAPGSTGSPHRITTSLEYPAGTVTASAVLGATGANPVSIVAPPVDPVGPSEPAADEPCAAAVAGSTWVAPTASATTPAALSAPR